MNGKRLVAATTKIAATLNAQGRAMRHVFDDLPLANIHNSCDNDVLVAIDAIVTAQQMVLIARAKISAEIKEESKQ